MVRIKAPKGKFPWDAHVPFPRTFPQVRINAKRPGNSRKEQMELTFSVWKFRLGIFQETPFSSDDQISVSIYIPTEISGFFE